MKISGGLASTEDANWIRLLNSKHALPSFLTLKADSMVLPCWVNNYCVLNSNTILDSYPLPHVGGILADCMKRKIWSQLDMTNSFFQTHVHPDDICLTVITTLFGLYEWMVMPVTEKCTSYPPVLNECCPKTSNWENLPHVHWQHCNLVKLSCRTC